MNIFIDVPRAEKLVMESAVIAGMKNDSNIILLNNITNI